MLTNWLPLVLLLAPFIVGLLAGAAFTRYIRWQGWPPKVISMLPISVMFGTLSYVVTLAVVLILVYGFAVRTVLGWIVISWPLWLLMGPGFYIYISQIKRRNRWLKNSTVYYLSGISFAAEGAFLLLLSRA